MSTFYNEVTYYTLSCREIKKSKRTDTFKLADKRANNKPQRVKKLFQKSRSYDRYTKYFI